MKKNIAIALALGSSFSVALLSGCQGIEGLFTDSGSNRTSSNYSYGDTHHSTTIYQSGTPGHARTMAPKANAATSSAQSHSSTTSASASTTSNPTPAQPVKKTGAAVPTEAPSVPSLAPTVGQ
ncbi:hypothetical protein [Legionella jordanis]|uniref:Lipoprotein n=1 Tax=Legionella jordanis TaxID=456 RepID=A0A0W0VD14_9GAMM|nr:hypothetical protein [Legionella jordanis]KTD18028.1 hypothetical protein Ljor_2334 [Legionella jordanis]RMX02285.1 hypothetical protein EAW55_08475 [Legionella jordanis]RMX21230.1 hypothetical protein EAS68_03395 [Legionella jordanis]VEH13880.1 Uncharacterised protein [Legionella jordanis]HAT8714262.1 hypothetical protein [Legionella jordanis]